MLHVPLDDDFNPAGAIAAKHAGGDDHPKVTLHDHEDLGHGFATKFGDWRDEDDAQAADARTAEFLARHVT